MVGILAECTGRQSRCLFLVPLWNPVLMAEQIGTLAAMADGPSIVQAGIGAGREQFAAMGANLNRRVSCHRFNGSGLETGGPRRVRPEPSGGGEGSEVYCYAAGNHRS